MFLSAMGRSEYETLLAQSGRCAKLGQLGLPAQHCVFEGHAYAPRMAGQDAGLETGGAAALEMAVSAALERGDRIIPCRNCSAPVLGIYCGQCGQAIETHRRSVFHLLSEALEHIASLDSRVLRTVRALFLQPGELSLAFHQGRTQRYVPAVRLYFFVSLIFFLTLSATHTAIFQMELAPVTVRHFTDGNGKIIEERNGETEVLPGVKADKNGIVVKDTGWDGDSLSLLGKKADGRAVTSLDVQPHFFAPAGSADPGKSATARRILDENYGKYLQDPSGAPRLKLWLGRDPKRILETLASNPSAINGPLMEWIPRLLFLLLPAFALLLAVFYWRQKADFYFVDHLVFSLNAFSFGFAAILLGILLARFISGGNAVLITLCAIFLHILVAMRRFYRQSWGWTVAKFALVSFSYCVIFLGPALVGIFLISFLNVE
jgi:hypothetical protein